MNSIEIEEYYRGDKIQCLICFREFFALGSHIKRIHGITSEEYKLRFDLPQSRSLAGERTRRIQSENLIRRIQDGDKRMKLTPETAHKAHHAPKYQMPKYAKDNLRERAYIYSKDILKISDENWNKFISEVEKTGKRAWELCRLPGMPNEHTVSIKRKKDPVFNQKYLNIFMEKEKKEAATYISLAKKGLSARDISKKLNISRKRILRILRKSGLKFKAQWVNG